LISNTPHALEVFTTPIATFENTPNWQKPTTPTILQILSEVEFVEVACVESVKEVISQMIIEGQSNLKLTFWGQNVDFKRG
jgi:hypothetical protein